MRLEEYCVENKIPYIGFDTFADIQREVKNIMEEDERKTKGMGKPARFNPRANMWRRVSSKQAVSFLLPSSLPFFCFVRKRRLDRAVLTYKKIPQYIALSPSKEEKMFLWPEAFSAPVVEMRSVSETVAA